LRHSVVQNLWVGLVSPTDLDPD